MEVNSHKAKTRLSRLLERVATGEEVIIVKAGKPVAKLVAVESRRKKFRFGSAKRESVVPGDFNNSLRKASRIFSINQARAEGLGDDHGDHFDRILIAQALPDEWPIVTPDPLFSRYAVGVTW